MNRLTIIASSLLLAAGVSHGAWEEVHTFEGDRAENLSKIYYDLHVPMLTDEYGGDSPLAEFIPDPLNPDDTVYWIRPVGQATSQGWLETFAFFPLGDNEIKEGSVGTIFYQVYSTAHTNQADIGTTIFEVGPGDPALRNDGKVGAGSADLPLGSKQDMGWPKYSTDVSYVNGTFGSRGYEFGVENFPLNEWVSIWQIIDTTTDTFQVYISSSVTEGEPTLLEGSRLNDLGEIETSSVFTFRNADLESDQSSIFHGFTAGSALNRFDWDPVYTDNFFVDPTSANTTFPIVKGGETAMWALWPIDPDGWVNTEAFLGWVNVVGEWVWVTNLNKYIYLPEGHVTVDGGWSYIGQ